MNIITTVDQLSRLVAEIVMGECWHEFGPMQVGAQCSHACVKCKLRTGRIPSGKPYATDANHALEVINWWRKSGEERGITVYHSWNNYYRVTFENGLEAAFSPSVREESFCIAICLAALRSVGYECEYKPE